MSHTYVSWEGNGSRGAAGRGSRRYSEEEAAALRSREDHKKITNLDKLLINNVKRHYIN